MYLIKRLVLPIFLAAIWICLSEFFRNQFLCLPLWLDHYKHLGLSFPQSPLNGAIWGVWSICFAIGIYAISRKYNWIQTGLLAWLFAFVLMWLSLGNLSVLPYKLLYYAIPLSLVEAFVASLIIDKVAPRRTNRY